MKTSKLIAAAALSVLAAAGAHAETYEGVHPLTTANSRANVSAEATVAARSGNPYGDGSDAGVQTVASNTDRAAVRAQAVAAAHNPLQSLDRRAFYRDQVPAAYYKPKVSVTRQAGL
ncbi:alpha/beta hydrolase [Variovorax sp. J2P1-59]|uniref:alpha/beta hydrolase n=1 Tax=Variovorax flavidus TaxID=3053501 RepID=UPI0025782EE0|nr:alpha/beta hydrolase [Variovorax sp. J2P1-59]MDM0077373.1 alpha/beta hydrolase [Variovorax sp. J2P1-59]